MPTGTQPVPPINARDLVSMHRYYGSGAGFKIEKDHIMWIKE
jgi:hypothetical protein